MIPYAKQHIDKRDINAVIAALGSDYLTQGPRVEEFEKALAKYCSAKYVVAVSNGTAALHLAYKAAGIGENDELITTPNTFAATANMMLENGARPVFCDIRMDTYNIDESKIEDRISKKTKAIIPVHFSGQPCDMYTIKSIAKKHKLLVIEDACHALGAKYSNNKVGSCKYSDMAVFSFHAIKSITTAEGGAILTNSKKLYDKLVLLRSHGIKKDKNGFNVMRELGYNYRLTELQSALGISQLKKLNKFIAARNRMARMYHKELKGINDVILPNVVKDNYSAWHIYVIRTRSKKDRMPLYNYLKKNNIGVNFHYPAVYSHPYYQKNGYKKIKLANTEDYQSSCITLPLFYDLTKTRIKHIGKIIRNYFHNKEV